MTAATTPSSGYGAVVTWAAHDIGYMRDISGPNITMDIIEISSHDSTDNYKEYVAGLLDGGEVSIEVLFIPGDTTGQSYFLTDLHARAERQVIITLPDGTSTWTFNALPVGLEFNDPYQGEMTATFTMKITGKPVFANS